MKRIMVLLGVLLLISDAYCECRSAIDVSCGEYHSLILTQSGRLWSCGANSNLALGVGSGVSASHSPVQVKGQDGMGYLSDIIDFDAGWEHSMACDSLGYAWAWGCNPHGQLGNNNSGNSEYPQKVVGVNGEGYLQNIVSVSAGRSGQHSLALNSNGYVYSWGYNSSGQCGNGTVTENLYTPVRVITDSSNEYLSNIISVNAGVSHSLALDENGRIWEFGGNNSSSKAKLVPGENGNGYLENIVAIATCANSLAVDSSGQVWEWTSGSPAIVSGLSNIIDVAAGVNYYIAFDSDGFLWKWDSSTSPYQITDGEMNTDSGYLENISAADAGYYEFELAVDSDGNVWSFGDNTNGRLGVGDTNNRTEPAMAECVADNLKLELEQTPTDTCLSPSDEVTVTICVDNESTIKTYENIYVVLHLDDGFTYPDGLDYFDDDLVAHYGDDRYDENSHSITLAVGSDQSGTIEPGELSCEVLTLIVNEASDPGMALINTVELIYFAGPEDPNGDYIFDVATETMPVCCWINDPETIYVDMNANSGASGGNGASWETAYNGHYGLARAFARAANSLCSISENEYKIYVAAGTYYPGTDEDDSFTMLDNMEIYGGFPSGGCDFAGRNPKKYKTVLTGQIDDTPTLDIDTVVLAANNTVIDGFTIEMAKRYNVLGEAVDFVVKNCQISNSGAYGIFAEAGNTTVKSCKLYNNITDGIYHAGEGFSLNIYNSWVMRSGRYGIVTNESTLYAKNNNISESDLKKQGMQGIFMLNPVDTPVLYNNTISKNNGAGIFYSTPDPNDLPDVQNCIIYYNNGGNDQLEGVDFSVAISYSCVQNCEEINSNINDEPMFAYSTSGVIDPNDFHLAYNSVCKDSGNSDIILGDETDYDNEVRIAGSSVDIGADEVYSCDGEYTEDDIYNAFDINFDGKVDMYEFGAIADSWLQIDPNSLPVGWDEDENLDPNDIKAIEDTFYRWNPLCNYDKTGDSLFSIDTADLEMMLAEEAWAWEACWYESSQTVGASTEAVTASATQSLSLMSISSASSLSVSNTAAIQSDIVVEEYNPYAELTLTELAEFVLDLNEFNDFAQEQIDSGSEDAEGLTEIMDFFDEVMADIKEYVLEVRE